MIAISRPDIGVEEKQAVLEVLESGMLAEGPRVAQLEAQMAKLAGVAHGVATSSGTTALHLSLLANGIGNGDEVITSPFTFIATANSIVFTGARPVFADVQEDSFNLDPDQVERAITPRTKAIMPVHLFGQMCDMDALHDIARRHRLAVIEDAAQAIGADDHGRPAGSFGTGVFSLYATKNVTSGEGGMIVTDDPAVASRARLLRSHGMRTRYQYESLGYNFRLTDLAAAIGLAQLGRLAESTEHRRTNADRLTAGLRTVKTPVEMRGKRHVWHQYTVRLDSGLDREAARDELAALGVGTGVFYPRGIHQFDHIRAITGEPNTFPVTERLAGEVLSIPVHPLLTPEEIERVIEAVNRVC